MTRLSRFVSALLVLALQGSADARRFATAAQALAEVVPGGDTGEIVRQFHEVIYGTFVKMDESLPAIRPYLKDPSPFVRYTAARHLYVAGDRSGYATLLELVQSPEPVLVRHNLPKEVVGAAGTNEEDLRISAATVLGKYRQRASAEDINLLLDATPKAGFELRKALRTMGVKVMPADTVPYSPTESSITVYGLVGARRFIPDLVATFEQPPPSRLAIDTELKVVTAWALAELTGEDRWVDYLVTAAKQALTPDAGGRLNYVKVTTALKYLGSLQHPAATPALEEALDAPDFSAVHVAVVNLLFNQKRGSEKAKQLLIRQLRGEPPRMQMRLLLNVASSFDDPDLEAAGRAFDRGSQDEWQRTTGDRKNWPIYNWIDDYVMRLNGIRENVRPERVLRGN